MIKSAINIHLFTLSRISFFFCCCFVNFLLFLSSRFISNFVCLLVFHVKFALEIGYRDHTWSEFDQSGGIVRRGKFVHE